MRKLLLSIALAVAMCIPAIARAQETDLLAGIEVAAAPVLDLGDLLTEGAQWIAEHGEIAWYYDLVGDTKGSETIAKLTLFSLWDVVNLDIGATIQMDSLDEAPGLAGGVGVKLSAIVEKTNHEWTPKWDVSAGFLGGYNFGDTDWMVGPTIGVSGRF